MFNTVNNPQNTQNCSFYKLNNESIGLPNLDQNDQENDLTKPSSFNNFITPMGNILNISMEITNQDIKSTKSPNRQSNTVMAKKKKQMKKRVKSYAMPNDASIKRMEI